MEDDNIIHDPSEQDKLQDDDFVYSEDGDIQDEKVGAVVSGSKLATLVSALPISNQEKTSLLELIENADIYQLQRLESGLEELYLDAKTVGVDSNFKENLEALKLEIEEQENNLEDETLLKFKNIEDRLNTY